MSTIIEIKQVGVTVMQEITWGRVYVDYVENGKAKFIFKNWIYFQEKTFTGNGSFEDEPAFAWFNNSRISDYKTVLNGDLDNMRLTPLNHRSSYGTPSKILKLLLDEIGKNGGLDVSSRRGWYTG